MVQVQSFTFNPFQENTFVLWDSSQECIIIDAGCFGSTENNELKDFIHQKNLTPVQLLNTHAHVDHVLGNEFVNDTYQLRTWMHKDELPILNSVKDHAMLFGMQVESPPEPEGFLSEEDTIRFGSTELRIILVPGHSPGHLAFISDEQKFVIGGDVLFRGSIGRTDLPGGNFDQLKDSILTKFYTLDESYKVYCGHGPETTIGSEKYNNPFVSVS